MDQQKWLLVKANFDGTEDLADGYYRLREVDGGYQLVYLVAGPCGDKNPHPEITLRQEGNQVPNFEPIRKRRCHYDRGTDRSAFKSLYQDQET